MSHQVHDPAEAVAAAWAVAVACRISGSICADMPERKDCQADAPQWGCLHLMSP